MRRARNSQTAQGRNGAWLGRLGVLAAVAAAALLVVADSVELLRLAVVCGLLATVLVGLSLRRTGAGQADETLRQEVTRLRSELRAARVGVEETVRREVDLVRGDMESAAAAVRELPRWETLSVIAEATRAQGNERVRVTRDYATGEIPRYVEPEPEPAPAPLLELEPSMELEIPPAPAPMAPPVLPAPRTAGPAPVELEQWSFTYDFPSLDHLPDPSPRGRHARDDTAAIDLTDNSYSWR